MNVYPINNIKFKANYYKVLKYGNSTSAKVMTDNAGNLGSKPVHINWNNGRTEMIYDGQYYITKFQVIDGEYKILYEDTGKYENQGKDYFLDKDKINMKIKSLGKSQNLALMEGNAKGLLIHAKDINDKVLKSNTPLIIICDNEEDCYEYFNKVEGIILKSGSEELLSHFSALCRDYFSFGHLVTDEQTINDLSKYEGRFISISNESKKLKYEEIAPVVKGIQTEEKIIVPKYSDEILETIIFAITDSLSMQEVYEKIDRFKGNKDD